MNFSNIAVLNINSTDYCCINNGISKSEAISLMQNINLTEDNMISLKQNIIKHKNLLFFSSLELSIIICCEKN